MLGVFVGGFYGAPIGVVFGSAYAVVAATAVKTSLKPSHDGLDRVVFVLGIRLSICVAAAVIAAPEGPWLLPPAAAPALGLGSAAIALFRLAARARVFRIEALDDGESSVGLLPVQRGSRFGSMGVVTRRPAEVGAAYRDMPHWVPVALAEVVDEGVARR